MALVMTPSFVNNDGASEMVVPLALGCSTVPLACQNEEALEITPELQKMKLSVHAPSSSRLARTSPASETIITSDEPMQKPEMQTHDMTVAPQAKGSATLATSSNTNSGVNKSSRDTHKCNNQDQPGKTYDSKGRCIHHPHIRLRKKKKNKLGSLVSGVSGTKRDRKKKWKILLSICPECCTEELLKDVCSSNIMPDYIRESIHRNDTELNGDQADGTCSSDCCIEDLTCTVTHNSQFIIEGCVDNSASRELCKMMKKEDRDVQPSCLDESSCSSLTNSSLGNGDELACIEEATSAAYPSFNLYHDIGLDLRTFCQIKHEADVEQIVPSMPLEESSLALYPIKSQPWLIDPVLDCNGSCGSVEVLADDDEWNDIDALACKENIDGLFHGKFKRLDSTGSYGTATTLSLSGSSGNVGSHSLEIQQP